MCYSQRRQCNSCAHARTKSCKSRLIYSKVIDLIFNNLYNILTFDTVLTVLTQFSNTLLCNIYIHIWITYTCTYPMLDVLARRFSILRRVPGRRMKRRRGDSSRKRVAQEAVAHFHAMTSSRIPAYVTGFGKCSFTSYGAPRRRARLVRRVVVPFDDKPEKSILCILAHAIMHKRANLSNLRQTLRKIIEMTILIDSNC